LSPRLTIPRCAVTDHDDHDHNLSSPCRGSSISSRPTGIAPSTSSRHSLHSPLRLWCWQMPPRAFSQYVYQARRCRSHRAAPWTPPSWTLFPNKALSFSLSLSLTLGLGCGGLYVSVYYCRTCEKAVSGGGEREKGGHVLKDTTIPAACAFESGHLTLGPGMPWLYP